MHCSPGEIFGWLAALVACATVGCAGEPPAPPVPPASPPPSVAMRVLVVNEPELAAAIERLRGEWAGRFRGTLSAWSVPWDEIANATSVDADLIVFPSRYLGELCAANRLRQVRANVLEGEAYDAPDIFPLARLELVSWGGQVMALPLGVRLPSEGMLVEVADDAVSGDRLGVLFDPESMQPRIAEPPFVDALTRLANGQPVRGRVPVLGLDDRLIGVTASSRNAASAFRLLEWLASGEISSQLASAAGDQQPVRRSQISSPAWYDSEKSSEQRKELGSRIERELCGERVLIVPRIPGIDRYLAALDAAVDRVKSGQQEPRTALTQAAAEWEAITDSLGRDAQRQAYAKHLGIPGP